MKGDNVASALPRSPPADEVTMVAVYIRCLYALLIIAQSFSSVHVREQIIYIFLTTLCTLSRAFTYLVTP